MDRREVTRVPSPDWPRNHALVAIRISRVDETDFCKAKGKIIISCED